MTASEKKAKVNQPSCKGRKGNDVSQDQLPCHGECLQVAQQRQI